MLDRLTADSFTPAIGDRFLIDAGEAGELELELLEARLHHPHAPAVDDSGARAPFSLLFRGPVDPLLPQRMYRFEHPSLGPLDIFVVPVARDDSGTSYEAVFG